MSFDLSHKPCTLNLYPLSFDLSRFTPHVYMKPDIQIIDPIECEGWDELLLSSEGYSFFHSSTWAKVLKETYGYSPAYFTIFDNGKLQALVPVMQVDSFLTGKRGVSLPFTDYCDAIISDGIAFDSLFDQILQYGKSHGWKFFEIRGGNGSPILAAVSCTYSRHMLDLRRGADEIFSNFKDNTRRNIRNAIKRGVKVEVSTTLDSLKAFHKLNLMTRRRHGLPAQPFHFFEKVHEHILSKNLGFVVLASYEGVFIAGAVFFHLGKKAVYKYGASDKKFHHLRPNNLVMWEAIKWFSQNGYDSLCFGRSEPDNSGLNQFKSGWGTTEHRIHYYRYDIRKNSFVSASPKVTGFHNKIFRKIPVPILNSIGNILYKHVG